MYNNPTYLKFIGLIMFIMLAIGLQAQNRSIAQGEYFWDTDPGQGNGTAFTAADGTFNEVIENIINTSVTIPTTVGNHTFNMRVQDQDGSWGPLFSVIIQVSPSLLTTRSISITAGEYFWDTDPGQGNGTAFLATDGTFNETLENIVNSAVNVPSTLGVHTFNIRVRDAANNWGPLFSTVIDVQAALVTQRQISITAGEYFWDTDPGQGNGTPYVAFDGNFDETLETLTNNNVSVPSTTGVHVLHTRARDAENNWGQPFRVVVNVLPNIVTARNTYVQSAEYYFDTDPGQGNGTPIFAQDGNFNAVLEAISGGAIPSPVTAGVHALYIRAQDVENNWGPAFGIVVNIDTTITGVTFTTSFSGDSVFCINDTANTYTYSAVSHGPTTFNWIATGGTVLSGQGTPNATIQWNGTQPASVKVVETGASYVDSAELNIVINPAPTISINASSMMVCSGQSVILTASGASTYTWSNGISNGGSFAPTTTASYQVTATDANTCFAVDSITIAVFPTPNVGVNASSTTVCAGEAVTLTGTGADTYTWDNGVTNGVSFIPTATTTYQVIGADASSSCADTTTVTITVNAAPTVTANASSTAVCDGEPVTLTGAGATTYTWDNGVTDGVSFIPTATTTYQVVGSNANACTDTATVTITVNAAPTVTANASSTAVCDGEPVTLTGAGATTYIWDNGVTDGVSFIPTATTTYQVVGSNANACTDTATVTVVVNPLPSPAITQLNGTYCDTTPSVNLIGVPSGGIFSGTNVSGTTFTPVGLAAGNYTISYVYTDNNGCSDSTSAQVTIQVCVTGINTLAASSVKVYPIPTEQLVWVEWSSLPTKNIQLRLLSVDGKVLLEREVLEHKINLDLSDFPSGMYFIQAIQETEIKTFKVIKE